MDDTIFPLLLSLLIILMAFFIIKDVSKKKKKVAMRPPGPWQLPFIGNMHNLFGSLLPHHLLRDLSDKHGPLMMLRLGTVPTLVVSSAKLAEEVLKTHGDNFADRPDILAAQIIAYNSNDIVFGKYGDNWRQMRKVCTMEVLSTKRVQSFRSIREDEVFNLINSISSACASGSAINLSKLLFSLTYTIIIRATFGKQWTQRPEEFSLLLSQAVVLLSGFNIADMYPSLKFLHGIGGFRARAQEVHRKMDEIFTNILLAHREKNAATSTQETNHDENIVDVLLRVQKEASDTQVPFTDDLIKAVIFDIFTAGSETAATTMEWAMSALVKHPEAMERAQAEVRQVFGGRIVDEKGLDDLKYFHCIIKETLRFHPPGPLLVPRENRQECKINGYMIPAKSKVLVNAWAISRDPKYWGHDAHLFKPERFMNKESLYDYSGTNSEYMPFGAGRRVCPGIKFALASIELPLAQLLYHFDWKLPDGMKHEELDMTEEFGIVMRKKSKLMLIPVRASSSFLVQT